MHELSALVRPVGFCQGPVSAATRPVCVLSGQGPGGFLKKTPQLHSLSFRWLHGQVHLSVQSLDWPFAVLVSLWGGGCFGNMEWKWQGGSQILVLHTHHPGGDDPVWTLTTFSVGFPCCPVGVSNLNYSLHSWSWPLMNQNPGTALFLKHRSIVAQGLLCFHSGFKFIGPYLHLPLSVRHHSFPIRKMILWSKLHIFIVILYTVNPAQFLTPVYASR